MYNDTSFNFKNLNGTYYKINIKPYETATFPTHGLYTGIKGALSNDMQGLQEVWS
jgi:hypothetical protein